MPMRRNVWNYSKAAEMARGLVKCQRGLPTDLKYFASSLHVASIEPANISIDGYLGRSATGELIIRYRESNSWARNRFTIAHELGHILLYKASNVDIPERTTRSLVRCNYEERYANRLASELLMPHDFIAESIDEHGLSCRTICRLSRICAVSFTAMLMRFLEVADQPIVLLKVKMDAEDPNTVSYCRCIVSQRHRILFERPPLAEAQDIIDALEDGRLCGPRIFVGTRRHSLACRMEDRVRLSTEEIGLLCY